MANSAQAKKRAKQNEKRRLHNASMRSAMRTAIKKVRYALADGKKDDAATAFKAAVPVIDSMVGKGLVARNTAARYKSRLNAQLKAI
ncbi:MAG: 30S ribosomal protein S20 [Gammaproteobacteria bacterium]|nr:30S ribosomal protein S20 [Gammaproteobacteria bacterium]MDH5727704.1 30S ribosomal protein S20 [Gammaproteobacteria bacterium]